MVKVWSIHSYIRTSTLYVILHLSRVGFVIIKKRERGLSEASRLLPAAYNRSAARISPAFLCV